MKILKTILFFVFISSSSIVWGQTQPDSVELKEFWNTQIMQLINKDTSGLSNSIQFPVSGIWPMFLDLGDPTEIWNKKDFFENIDKLIPPDLILKLKEQNFSNVEVVNDLGFTELFVMYSRNILIPENGEFDESAMFFCYKRINGKWKLWSIQIAG